MRQEGERWTELAPIDTPDGKLQINEYFVRHPEMMLGRMGLESAQYGAAPALIGSSGTRNSRQSRLASACVGLFRLLRGRHPLIRPVKTRFRLLGQSKKVGWPIAMGKSSFAAAMSLNRSPSRRRLPPGFAACFRSVTPCARSFALNLQEAPEETIIEARRHLNRSYDLFVSRFGPLNAVQNVRAFANDPDQPLLLSLEEFNPETKLATKTAIFDRRTLERYRPVERVETASEALLVSLNETGQINWPRMEALTGKPASDLQDELGSLAYRNPEGGAWETADRYLSGNVRAKLVAAQASARLDPAYQRNVEALQAVQPPDLEPGEIEARLGSSWIPRSDIRDLLPSCWT